MVCQELDELEGDFLQARAESQYMDSLGWTDREVFVPSRDTGAQAGRTSRQTLCRGLKQYPIEGSDANRGPELKLGQTLPNLGRTCAKEPAHTSGKSGVEVSKGVQPIPPFADADTVILLEPRIARNEAYNTYIRTSPPS